MVKRISADRLAYAGLCLTVLLLIPRAQSLSAFELARLAVILVPFVWLAWRGSGLSRVFPFLLPFYLVFLVSQFDPAMRPSLKSASELDLYSFATPATAVATFALAIIAPLREGRLSSVLSRLDGWCIGITAGGGVYVVLFGGLFQGGLIEGSVLLLKSAAVISYGLFFVSARLLLRDKALQKVYAVLLIGLSLAALVAGTSRLYDAYETYGDAAGFVERGDCNDAEKLLNHLEDINTGLNITAVDAEIHYLRGLCSLGKGDTEAALSEAGAALTLRPDEGRYQSLMGDVHLARREWRQAAVSYEKGLRRGRSTKSACSGLALAYARLKYFWQGSELKSCQGRLGDAAVTLGDKLILADALNEWGRYENALDITRAVLDEHPDSVAALVLSGNSLLSMGRPKEAESRALDALELSPSPVFSAYGLLEEVYAETARPRDAEKMRDECLGMESRHVNFAVSAFSAGVDVGRKMVSMYNSGFVWYPLSLCRGSLNITVIAKGTPAGGGYPQFVARLNGKEVARKTVDSPDWAGYSFSVEIERTRKYVLEIEYANDLYIGSNDDRNLFIKEVSVER